MVRRKQKHLDTAVSLEVYLLALREADRRFHDERDRRYSEIAIERSRAVDIAFREMDIWRTGHNEWKELTIRRESTFAREDVLDVLGKRIDRLENRGASLYSAWGFLIGAIGLVATIVTIAVLLWHGASAS